MWEKDSYSGVLKGLEELTSHSKWIAELRREWVGKYVLYGRAIFKVTDVSCRGYLEISGNSDTDDIILVSQYEVKKIS